MHILDPDLQVASSAWQGSPWEPGLRFYTQEQNKSLSKIFRILELLSLIIRFSNSTAKFSWVFKIKLGTFKQIGLKILFLNVPASFHHHQHSSLSVPVSFGMFTLWKVFFSKCAVRFSTTEDVQRGPNYWKWLINPKPCLCTEYIKVLLLFCENSVSASYLCGYEKKIELSTEFLSHREPFYF